jgi:hypothetical protein
MTKNYRGNFKASARLNLGKDTSTITDALISHIRLSAMNLLAFAAMDKSTAKGRDDLMNMLASMDSLHKLTIKWDAKAGELYVGAEGTISIKLEGPKKRKK